MAFVHKESCECTKSELDLFTIPPTQTSVEKGQWVDYLPIANITDGGPIEFAITGAGDDYLDLASTQLYIKAKIINEDGTDLADGAPVGPVNLFLQSLFSQVDVTLNGRLISPSTPTYPYRAIIETLLNYGPAAKQSQLTASMFYKDTAGKMDVVNPTEANPLQANLGLNARYRFSNESQAIEMIGPLHSDIFFQNKYMLNGVDVRVKLIRSKDSFCLVSSENPAGYRVSITQAILFVKRMKLSPSVMIGHAKALEKSTAKYPIRRVVCKMISVPRGNMTLTQDHIFLGQLPQRIVIGCVDNTAFNGSFLKNPFNFQHYHTNFLAVHLDGEQIPGKPLKPDFTADGGLSIVRAFHTLFSGTDKMYQDQGIDISREDFARGYTLYAFDLTPDLSAGSSHFNLVKEGNLKLEMHFAQALPRTMNIVVYAEFENVIEIDKARNIIFDYSS